jgi:hypothetical protein
MKIKLSLVLIAGMSLASSTFLQAGITVLKANGNFLVTNTSTGVPIRLEIGNTAITAGALTTNYLGATEECDFNGVRVGKGNGALWNNTAIGYAVLDGYLPTGTGVTGVGYNALKDNSSGGSNTAIGYAAMQSNTSGFQNTASGVNCLLSNTSGNNNTAMGVWALNQNTAGHYNTAIGCQSLNNNQGNSNTVLGMNSLYCKTSGDSNIAIGNDAAALQINGAALTSTTGSIYIGVNSRGFNNADYKAIVIGTDALGEGANTTVIGTNTTVSTHLYGKTISDSLQVNGNTVISGNTVLSGTVVLAQPQGDISMGAYQ